MGRCIYGGIYDPGNPLSDAKGFRNDVKEALLDLKVPCFRYPGGNFVCTYNWLDGVGPRELRPKRPELAWKGIESNQIGTDEFLHWCEEMKAEPYLCLNMTTGTLMEGWRHNPTLKDPKLQKLANSRRYSQLSDGWNIVTPIRIHTTLIFDGSMAVINHITSSTGHWEMRCTVFGTFHRSLYWCRLVHSIQEY